MKELMEQRKQLAAMLHERLKVFLDEMGVVQYNKWEELSISKIQREFPDAKERESYMLWHILIGGTPGQCLNFDFSGEYSIQQMIEDLQLENEKKKQKNTNA